MSEEHLGMAVGVSHWAIRKYEGGKRQPDIDTLTAIADALTVSLDWLLGRC